MWNEFEEPVSLPEPPEKKRRFWWILISFILIIALLGSSVGGMFWIWQFWRSQTAVSAITQSSIQEEIEPTAEIRPTETVEEEALMEATVPPVPTSPPLVNNRIVFVNLQGRIGTVAPTGEDEHILTSGNRRYVFPAWSPDGESVASIGVDSQGATIDVLADESDAEVVEVYSSRSESPFYIYWSPDSQQISFLASHPREPMALHVVDSGGDSDSQMITTGGPFYWAWDPDSSQMLVHTGFAGDDAKLTFVEPDGAVADDNLAAPGYFQVPGISADGRFVAYAEETRKGSRIVVTNQASGDQFSEAHGGIAAMSWSPVANQLAFINNPQPEGTGFVGPLQMIDAETNEVTLLSREPVLAFFWSPSGRYLLYMSYAGNRSSDANASRPAAPQRGAFFKPAQQFGRPEFDIVLIDTTTGNGQILMQKVEFSRIFFTQFLPFFNQYSLSHQIWSPESDAVVLPFIMDNREIIAILNVNGGRLQPLTNGEIAFWSHQ
ncbi:MAG: hypothetical protein DWQ04_03715 [Chloroflexi bacterium]|nr:MAG: hypothetical protein DWQ04_03715 [Chloroflexota bacterium]